MNPETPETPMNKPDPKEVAKGKTSSQASVDLSELRTGLSEHRTELSEHRTELSDHRTQQSDHRTELSENRTSMSVKRTAESDVRSHLANERTLLAYQRTGISLISFGVTLNRFSIFLLQNELSKEGGRAILHETKYAGLGMVMLGSAMLIWSVVHYLKTANVIDKALIAQSSRSVLVFSMIVILLGTATTVWMFLK
jgi:putative membrane protein